MRGAPALFDLHLFADCSGSETQSGQRRAIALALHDRRSGRTEVTASGRHTGGRGAWAPR